KVYFNSGRAMLARNFVSKSGVIYNLRVCLQPLTAETVLGDTALLSDYTKQSAPDCALQRKNIFFGKMQHFPP
ncbi:MAG: hypothetical protein IJY74_01235, partial [Oscillospiraceae bacterium]|nr:hypothetical protein [Oscillospiraceae bacterium]